MLLKNYFKPRVVVTIFFSNGFFICKIANTVISVKHLTRVVQINYIIPNVSCKFCSFAFCTLCSSSRANQRFAIIFYRPPTNLREDVFTRVCLSTGQGPHVTITHDHVLDLIVQTPPPPTWDLRIPVTSGGHHWKPVQTCSLQDPLPTSADIWRLLKQARSLAVGGTHLTDMLPFYRPQTKFGAM